MALGPQPTLKRNYKPKNCDNSEDFGPHKGRILDDFSKLMMYSGNLPDGVDIFVAVNQRADRKRVEEKSYNCGDAYGMLDNFIWYGVSQVNWGAIAP